MKLKRMNKQQLANEHITWLRRLQLHYVSKHHRFGEAETCPLCRRFRCHDGDCKWCPWVHYQGYTCTEIPTLSWTGFVCWLAKRGFPGLRIKQINGIINSIKHRMELI